MIAEDAVLQLQARLASYGIYTGKPDNDPGPLTQTAIEVLKGSGQTENIQDFQHTLNWAGVQPQLVEDGVWGSKTDSAWQQVVQFSKGGDADASRDDPGTGIQPSASTAPAPTVQPAGAGQILSNPNCKWTVEVDGPDLILRGPATCFGGYNDPQDDGTTASGYNTKGHPDLLACSLPMRMDSVKNLRGSPLPFMHFGIDSHGRDLPNGPHVIVTFPDGSKSPLLPVVDIGPALYTGNVIDLTEAAARLYDPKATASSFGAKVSYRVIGGAKWVS